MVGETPCHYLVECRGVALQLAGRRWLRPGEQALVPKRAVRLEEGP